MESRWHAVHEGAADGTYLLHFAFILWPYLVVARLPGSVIFTQSPISVQGPVICGLQLSMLEYVQKSGFRSLDKTMAPVTDFRAHLQVCIVKC